MDNIEFDFIDKCIDNPPNVYYYFRDKYAIDLLKWFVGPGKTVNEVKTSRFGFLLDKPVVKDLLKRLPGNKITRTLLDTCWPAEMLIFKLSFGEWKSIWSKRSNNFGQTSRPGKNLVIRLDFANDHNRLYEDLISPNEKKYCIFETRAHPINKDGKTLAWARIDIDLRNGEVLIEEIQNDWLRFSESIFTEVAASCENGKMQRSDGWFFNKTSSSYNRFALYTHGVLSPYKMLWDEAVLSAAIWFIKHELGINRIYYNTWDTGNVMKNIAYNRKPPRSLYTKLPRRFGFKITDRPPRMISHMVKKMRPEVNNYEWFLLEV